MENEIKWAAISANDTRFDDAFVYAVTTTGIYCRPSCASKLPKRDNVKYFPTPTDAESNGFRACLRCGRDSLAGSPELNAVVAAAETMLSDEFSTPESVAGESGLDASRFRKLFTRMIGVTPKKFAEAARLERFRTAVRSGMSVTEALYDAGFGSSSRLYEKVGEKLGMTPGKLSKGAPDESIVYAVSDCRLGKVIVARTGKGICAIALGDSEDELVAGLRNEFPRAAIAESDSVREIVETVVAVLDGKPMPELPLDIRATAFQARVWDELRRIPYGETVSYQQVAERLGNRSAVRAVARACATNRIAIAIPCHRVVRSDGELSGYRWGIERKREILSTENGQRRKK